MVGRTTSWQMASYWLTTSTDCPQPCDLNSSNGCAISRTVFPQAILIVSSRPAAIDAYEPIHLDRALMSCAFDSITLEPMSLSDSEILVEQWHSAVARDRSADRAELEAYARNLRRTLREKPPIRNLASNPLLCSMICALNWDRRERLPDNRMQLYHEALQMFLVSRDEQRNVRPAFVEGFTYAEKRAVLEGI